MINYWCLHRQITNICHSRRSLKVDVKWLFIRFRTSPPSTIDFDSELSESTAAARSALCETHREIVSSLRTGVHELFYCSDPLHSSDSEKQDHLARLVKKQFQILIDAMEKYGEDVLLPLYEVGTKAELKNVLETEFSVLMTTICLFHEIYGLEEIAAALEENQEWLGYTKVVRQHFPTNCLSPEQSFRRLKEMFPDSKWPETPKDLGVQASEEPQGAAVGREHRGLGKQEVRWQSDEYMEVDDGGTPRMIRYDEETGIELFPPNLDDDMNCPAEWDLDYCQGLGPFVLDCGQQAQGENNGCGYI